MKKQVYNPYLPLYEYTPDCEPHVFDGRIYVFGSHDCFGAFPFCLNNYVTYSAPVDDLSDWRFEGEILDKREDPDNKKGKMELYAPDVTKGPDGRYYIYYAFSWNGKIGVAVSNTPNGKYKFLGHVHYKDGTELGRKKGDAFPFDPGILTDTDGRVYLYSGFGPVKWFPQIRHGLKPKGGFVMELEKDMLTIKRGPEKIFSKANDPISLNHAPKEHSFFEASSIRKINDTYYFIYSSLAGHELCYMTSKDPFGPFEYQGVIISNGNIGYKGRSQKDACYPLGNNHGSIEKIKDDYYVFYHRHTNYTNTDRQDCAEKIHIEENGFIPQVEMTSCGLNGGPLQGKGTYPASICCHLKPKKGNTYYPFFALPHQKKKLRITQSSKDSSKEETQYIQNIGDGCEIGYKYFDLKETKEIVLNGKGSFHGSIILRKEEKGKNLFEKEVDFRKEDSIVIPYFDGKEKEALFFLFKGKGKLSLYTLALR